MKTIPFLLDVCNEKLEIEPENIEVIRLRGILYNMDKLYDEAILDFDSVISHFPNNEKTYYLRSHCYFAKGEYTFAKQDLLRALKIENKDDLEFVEGCSEPNISEVSIKNEEEKKDMRKILEYEKNMAFLNYFSILS